MNRIRLDDWSIGPYALTIVSLLLTAGADGWRTAALAGVAIGAVLLTRTRFAVTCATAYSFLVALLVIAGPGVSG